MGISSIIDSSVVRDMTIRKPQWKIEFDSSKKQEGSNVKDFYFFILVGRYSIKNASGEKKLQPEAAELAGNIETQNVWGPF